MPNFRRRTGANMAMLIDTQALAWLATGDPRLSRTAAEALLDESSQLLVSAVTAYEFADLNRRGRFDADLPLQSLLTRLDATIVDYPGSCWSLAASLPLLHRDPVDRMVIAHAIHSDLTLVTADTIMRRYPVQTLW